MTVLTICCSVTGYRLLQRLQETWRKQLPAPEFITIVKCRSLPELSETRSLSECVGEWFPRVDAIIFLCAAGIAVRSIAPCLVHKAKDPAVVVIDETGQFCISLLSGHMGGANELTRQTAELIGALPVITTATDREHRFAPDDFARKNGLFLGDWTAAKELAVRILEGRQVGFYSQLPTQGRFPPELGGEGAEAGLIISDAKEPAVRWRLSLQLVPRLIIVGIGCRKGTPKEKIGAAVSRSLEEAGIREEAVGSLASIDLKQKEPGILAWCREKGIPFETFPADVLLRQPGDFSESAFVQRVTGVSNVCERSAVAAGGRLLCGKRIYDGVTVALARREGSVVF